MKLWTRLVDWLSGGYREKYREERERRRRAERITETSRTRLADVLKKRKGEA